MRRESIFVWDILSRIRQDLRHFFQAGKLFHRGRMRQISQGAQLEPLGRSSLPENDFDIFDLHKLIFRIIFRIIQISNIVSLLFFLRGMGSFSSFPPKHLEHHPADSDHGDWLEKPAGHREKCQAQSRLAPGFIIVLCAFTDVHWFFFKDKLSHA
jgi:hypothetical protein